MTKDIPIASIFGYSLPSNENRILAFPLGFVIHHSVKVVLFAIYVKGLCNF